MSTNYLGQILPVAFPFVMQGWAACNGALLSISDNSALFQLLGTTYGGDGQTTFALPNLNGNVPVHAGQASGMQSYTLGETGGAANVTVTGPQLPAHTHPVNCNNGAGSSAGASGQFFAKINFAENVYGPPGNPLTMAAGVSPAGGSQAHTNLQPYLAINYQICLEGIYPTSA